MVLDVTNDTTQKEKAKEGSNSFLGRERIVVS